MEPSILSALVDDLAHRLDAPTELEDREQRVLAYSSHIGEVDDVRRDSILRRETSPEVRTWFRQFGILEATEPLWPDVRTAFGWVHRAAAVLRNKAGLDAAGVKRRYIGLIAAVARHRRAAGRLAELTGMSTSAITAVLDRLERRGFVERRRDPADRRKVIVVATGEHIRRTTEIFARLAEATATIVLQTNCIKLS